MPEIRYGSGPVTLLLPYLIGQKKSNEIFLTGDSLDAAEALELGIINEIVPVDELAAAVARLTSKITPTPLPVLKYTKLGLIRAYEAMGCAKVSKRTLTSRRFSTRQRLRKAPSSSRSSSPRA